MEEATTKLKAAVLDIEEATKKLKAATLEMEEATKKRKAAAVEMEEARKKRKAAALEIEEATKKAAAALDLEAAALDVEVATKKRATIPILPDDVILTIFRFLDTQDRIAFSISCEAFRRLCMDESSVFRKTDLSRCVISTTQRNVVNKFFRDRQLTQHIRELNLNNLHVINWQMDDQLIVEFVISICPQLEALHILNCGMSLQRLHLILKQAPKLTALSWSLVDFTSEDIQFIVKSIKSSSGIFLENIKHLRLEILVSKSHIQIAKYLLLSCFRDLEELEIYILWIDMECCNGQNLPLRADQFITGFPQPSVENKLQYLHSLMVVAVRDPVFDDDDDTYEEALQFPTYDFYTKELSDFVVSVLSRKSSPTKWKKLWISPSIRFSTRHLTDLSLLLHQDDFQSVEAVTANPGQSAHTVDEVKSFFQRIGDNTVRSLHLCLPYDRNSIVQFCDPILRVAEHSLKFLRLSGHISLYAEENLLINSLFLNCTNITELDLLGYCFEEDICKPLSKLKHLNKVQLMECAIISKHWNQVEISKANFVTFVQNCKNITHLDVRGCGYCDIFHCLTDNLLALAKLRKLKSLTLCGISGITEWNFLQNILEHDKFLSTLRIRLKKDFCNYIQISMGFVKYLKHLALDVEELDEEEIGIGSEGFWNHLSHGKNLQRLCIRSSGMLNISLAMQTLKCLPRLQVLHLHNYFKDDNENFYDQVIKMLEEKESDCRFSFEIVTGGRKNTWINHQTGYRLISNKALPLNEAELCDMRPVLDIPRF